MTKHHPGKRDVTRRIPAQRTETPEASTRLEPADFINKTICEAMGVIFERDKERRPWKEDQVRAVIAYIRELTHGDRGDYSCLGRKKREIVQIRFATACLMHPRVLRQILLPGQEMTWYPNAIRTSQEWLDRNKKA